MGIALYLKEIGRGKNGARALERPQAADLMGQILDDKVTPLQLGAFCLAMRIKGESPQELAGFLDAIHARLPAMPFTATPTVVLPCYNGARKLPVLTPLLALALARCGYRVLVHGPATNPGRITSHAVLLQLADMGHPIAFPHSPGLCRLSSGVDVMETQHVLPGIQRLLDVRNEVGLRNSGHSLVKLMQPCTNALLISSYTHPEYLQSISALFQSNAQWAMLLRGTEGEPVADPRRQPRIDLFQYGQQHTLVEAQTGSLAHLPTLPAGDDMAATATYIDSVLAGRQPMPHPIAHQLRLTTQVLTGSHTNLSPALLWS